MVIFDGKKISQIILEEIREGIKKIKIPPRLAIIQVGETPEIELYVRNKKKAAEEVGIEIVLRKFLSNTGKEKIKSEIKKFNQDISVHGIIVQLPLALNINPTEVVSEINPRKDVDGFHPQNRQLLKKGKPIFLPPLPSAISIALQYAMKYSQGEKIVSLTKSNLFSETLSDFLKLQGIKVENIIFKGEKRDVFQNLRKADIIISVLGEKKFLKGDFLKKGVAIIDAGIVVENNKVFGDADPESVKKKASFITPVPGGIGPLVVALLLNNVYLSAERLIKNNKD